MDETHFMEEISRAARTSFLIGAEESGRGAENTALSELDAIAAWVTETIRQYLLLDDVLCGRTVLELRGGEMCGRRPTEAESIKLRAWLSTVGRRG